MMTRDTQDANGNHARHPRFSARMLAHARGERFLSAGVPAFTPAGTVIVGNLFFRYANHLPAIFHGLSLDIPAGRLAALVGPRGCGKSTFVQLLQGLHKPQLGSVLACGRVTATGSHLPARVAVVPREPMLFGGSVIGNLLMANPEASFSSIVRACQMAQVHDAIMALPAAYDTEIGEGGMMLKAGPRQCISLARALLRDPDILVLDDSFDMLDPEWSAALARAVNGLKGRLTVLAATRHLGSGLNLDMVFSMRQPRLLCLSVVEGRDAAGASEALRRQ